VLIAIGLLIWWQRTRAARKRQQTPAAPGPVDPFADADTDVLRGDPRRVKAGDMVEAYGKTLAVRGSLHLKEGGYSWSEHFLDTGTGVKRWLSVEADPDLELVLWEEVSGSDLEPGPREISHEGDSYSFNEKGKARYTGEATTGLDATGTVHYHDYEGPAVELAERDRLVQNLGAHEAMILRNHGLLTCGATIPQAFNTMYQLELACRTQVDAMAARTELTLPPREVLDKTAHLYQPQTRRPYGVLEWPAMLRLLEAEQKNSAFPPYWT
jgi:hypothetical protein